VSAKTTEEFVLQAKIVHGKNYDYSKTIYKTCRVNINIICSEHGEFSQRPNHHLDGSGCPKCADVIRNDNSRLDFKDFMERATKVHGSKYDYSKVKYVNTKTKVIIGCKLHGDFQMNLNNHVGGKQGCPTCGRLVTSSSLLIGEPTILYYIKFFTYDGPLYKIGITVARRGIKGRFSGKQIPPYEVLREVTYNTGQAAFKEEQRLHKEHREFKYEGPDILPGGNTELFVEDVLNLDSSSTPSR